jgi:leader peptidase (prepilin peptidase)/N-methyltransferase
MNITLVASWACVGAGTGRALAISTSKLLTADHPAGLPVRWMASAVTGVLFAALAWRFDAHFDLIPYSFLAAVGVALGVIDMIERRLPSQLVLSGLATVGASFAISAALYSTTPSLLRALAGMAVLAGFYLALALVSRGGLGAGDVKLGGLLGLALGWLGWSTLLTGTLLGWLAAAIAWIVLRTTRRWTRDSLLPMGPFLLLGALIVVVLPSM